MIKTNDDRRTAARHGVFPWLLALLIGALTAGCGSGGRDPILGFDGPLLPAFPDRTQPRVIFTVPADGDTGVATNTQISATFSEAMAPATINATTFTVTNDTTATAVVGNVTYNVASRTAVFTPTAPATLPANNTFTAQITAGATDLSGNPLGTGPVPNPWSFGTGATADMTAPTVTIVNPPDTATGVCRQQSVSATFDEDMDPSTINNTTFTLQLTGPPLGPVLAGTVTYDAPSRVATFNPTGDLPANTDFTATITTGAEDLAGNPLAADVVWEFETGTQACLSPVALGAAAPFGGFGGGAGLTNQGTLTVINGDIGTTGASTTVTGFHDTQGDIYTETPANIGTVNGTIFTCPPPPGGAGLGGTAATCAVATQALADAQTAFNNLSPAALPGGTDPGAGELGGLTLLPGIYQAAGGSFQITGADLTLDAQGDADAVWVFQMASTLTVGAPGFPQSVILANGAQAKNVFWRVGSSATINAAGGGTMVGTIISSAGTTFSTAGNVTIVTLNGRALALNASVTMVNTVINVPAP